MHIRAETKYDRDAVRAVNTAAFETPAEADLVDALRQQAYPVISLVAEHNGEIVGHILFSPASFPDHRDINVMALAPMAVAPAQQRTGIGSALVRAGLEQCRELDCAAVVVLGHPDYYPRFGFAPASRFDIGSEYDVPDEVFMAVELQPDALAGKKGIVRFHPAFSDV